MELFVDIKKKLLGCMASNSAKQNDQSKCITRNEETHNSQQGFELDVNFETSKDALGILGASGSGKSMTLRCIAGLETPDSGKIVLNGRVLFDSKKGVNMPSRLRNTGFLFQNYALFPHMNVEQNIKFALGNLSIKEQIRITQEKIDMLQLNGFEKRYPSQLSGGQQQRVALARALAVAPEALLLDEPFSALDEHLRNNMVKQLIESLAEYPGTILFVTHNMEEVYRVCKNILILSNGKKEAFGGKNQIFRNPPTLSAAKITGCKNISKAKRLSTNKIKAEEWGIELEFNDDIKDISYVGIRAHYITMADNSSAVNVFPCTPAFTSETPFRMTIYLSIEKQPYGLKDYHLQWEITKERWYEIQNLPLPWKIQLKPEKLILITC